MSQQRSQLYVLAVASALLLGLAVPSAAAAATPTTNLPGSADASRPVVMQEGFRADQGKSLAGYTPAVNAPPRALAPRSAQPAVAAPANGALNREVFAFSYAGSLDDTVNNPPTFGYRLWDFSVISTVGYFGLGVLDSGSLDHSSTGWLVMQTSQFQQFRDTAHAKGTKVVLTIVLQDFASGTPHMCNGLANQQTTVNETIAAVNTYGADGVNVDYEGLGGTCSAGRPQDLLVGLAAKLRAGLAPGRNYLSIDTYGGSAADRSGLGFFLIPNLNSYVDAFFVMSYDMEYSNWRAAGCTSFCLGPTAPLTGYSYNDTGEMADYTATVPASKVILGVPYYGRKACVAAPIPNAQPVQKPNFPNDSWVDADRYVDALYDAYQQPNSVTHHMDANDPAGAERWEIWHSNLYGCDRELYWDDANSLGLKYDLVNRDQLRGVGIWTVNYGEAQELWDTLRTHFANLPGPPILSAVHSSSYHLDAANDGAFTSWVEIDPGLRAAAVPVSDGSAVVTANIDLWTTAAGYNQDVGVFVSRDAGPDLLQAWKESGGVGGTYSPNAAFVQAVVPVVAGHSYVFKLKWKPNKAAPGQVIFAGAGTVQTQFSPTRLTVRLVPSPIIFTAVQNISYHLDTDNDGGFSSWVPVDPALDVVVPGAETTVQVSANMDLWTARAGYNQDFGVFVNDSGNPSAGDQQLAWKENGSAATQSPNAAFVVATYVTHSGHTYTFKLKWKPNRAAPGGTLYGAAGTAGTQFSPTRVTVEQMIAGSFQSTANLASFHIDTANSGDFVSWVELNPTDRVTIHPATAVQALVTGNMDLWTSIAGFNQDLGIFSCDAALADCSQFANFGMIAWKESGGSAGFSPTAATAQAVLALTPGHPYTFALGWKANRPAPAGVVYGGAGTAGTQFSPTTLVVQLGS